MISDVPGDDPAFIGSGPTVADVSVPEDALRILMRWKIPVSDAINAALLQGSGVVAPGDVRLSRVTNRIYAAPAQSLAEAARWARDAGCDVQMLGDAVEGEARMVAQEQAAMALAVQRRLLPGDAPVILLSGGELTVTRTGDGVGGPNSEFCLALAIALQGAIRIHAIACDTDGVDGAAEVAGALISPETLELAAKARVDPTLALARNDAHSFFESIGGQVITGPTLTNVNDFRAILVKPATA